MAPNENITSSRGGSKISAANGKNKKAVEFEVCEDRPNFTLEDLRKAIPRDCFERSLAWSIFYFVRDVAAISTVYWLMYAYNDVVQKYPYIAYPLFWWTQGLLFWAFFVVGHDCGHGSFSSSDSTNYFFGNLSHTLILVPFHSWRLSHKRHHQNTGNADNDETFVPPKEKDYREMDGAMRFFRYHAYWLGGWVVYLFRGMPNTYYSHFDETAPVFKDAERPLVKFSVTLVKLWALTLVGMMFYFGPVFMIKYYWIPFIIMGSWIAMVTHSHHTHPDLPWFRGTEWNFLRGALSTVDRNYGVGIEHIHHNIGTHVVHHIFSKIPHYHLLQATEAIKPILGKYYHKSSQPIVSAMMMMHQYCRYVPNEGNIVYYQIDK